MNDELDKRIDLVTFQATMEQKADIVDVFNSLKHKSNHTDVIHLLETKLDASQTQNIVEKYMNSVQQKLTDRIVLTELNFARKQDVDDKLNEKVSKEELIGILQNKLDSAELTKLHSETNMKFEECKSKIDLNQNDFLLKYKQISLNIETLDQLVHKLSESTSTSIYSHSNQIMDVSRQIESAKSDFKLKSRDLEETLQGKIAQTKEELQESERVYQKKMDLEIEMLRNFAVSQIDECSHSLKNKLDAKDTRELLEQKIELSQNYLRQKMESDLSEKTHQLSNQIKDINEGLVVLTSYTDSKVNKKDYERQMKSIKTKFVELVTEQSKALLEQLGAAIIEQKKELKIASEDLESKKLDLDTFNAWVEQHTKDVNSVLNSKSNLDDMLKIRDIVQTKSDDQYVKDQLTDIKRELNEQTIVKSRLDNFIQKMSENFVDRPHFDTNMQKLTTSYEKLQSKVITEYTQVKSDTERLFRTVNEKVDRPEFNREISQLESGKISRKEFEKQRKEEQDRELILLERLEKIEKLQTMFDKFTAEIQSSMRKMDKNKVEMKEMNSLNAKINEFHINKHETEALIDNKMIKLRDSIEALQKNIQHLLDK